VVRGLLAFLIVRSFLVLVLGQFVISRSPVRLRRVAPKFTQDSVFQTPHEPLGLALGFDPLGAPAGVYSAMKKLRERPISMTKNPARKACPMELPKISTREAKRESGIKPRVDGSKRFCGLANL